MRTNRFIAMFATLVGALAMTSCGTIYVNTASSRGAATYSDDLYGVHDRASLAAIEAEIAAAEAAAKAENEKRIAAMVAAANSEANIDDLLGSLATPATSAYASTASSDGANVSIYNNIYVDDYSSAYARRLQGFTSLTYRMPSSYWDYRYGDAYFLTLAYDPAFYTVMVVGDQVWVEPRYITNMFGSWNNPYYYSYRYGYNPYYYGYSYGYYDPWCWNSPYWGCDPFYHYYSHHYWHDHHYHSHHNNHSHKPGYHPGYHNPSHRPGGPGGHFGSSHGSRVEHRPSYGTTGRGSVAYPAGNRPSYNDRLGGNRTNDRGATQIAGGGSSAGRGGATIGGNRGGTSARPGSTVTSARPGGTPNVSAGRGGATISENKGKGNKETTTLTPTKGNSTLVGGSLKESLNGTTLRGNSSTGTSNSSSRSGAVRVGGTSGKSSATSRSSSSSSSKVKSPVSTSRSSSSKSSTTRSSNSSSSRNSSSVSSSSSSRSSSSYSSSSRSSSSSSSRSSSSSSSRGGSRR